MSFGLRKSFGRLCRKSIKGEYTFESDLLKRIRVINEPPLKKNYTLTAGYIDPKRSAHVPLGKWGDTEIEIKHPPTEPSRVVKGEVYTYYYDEDDYCYSMIHNWLDFNEEDKC